MHIQLAFDARGHRRIDNTRLSFETCTQHKHVASNQPNTLTFSAAIHKRLQTSLVIHIHHAHKCRIDPPPGFDTVESTDDNVELHVVVLILVLDLANKRCDFDTFDTLLNEPRRGFGFRLANVGLTEEKLSVQVRDIDCIWIG